MRQAVILGVMVFFVAGCATTTGKKITEEQMAKFQVGKTTKSEIIQELGKPNVNSESPADDGRKIMYTRQKSDVDNTCYIPYINMLMCGGSAKSKNTTFHLNGNGVLEDITETTTRGET
jgi:hypothetical protein